MTLLLRMSTLLLRAWRRHDGAAVFEHVDSKLLDGDAFRASHSMGLDGAPFGRHAAEFARDRLPVGTARPNPAPKRSREIPAAAVPQQQRVAGDAR